ncbi:MAG: copper homeostasis protein CutC [Bacteroidales bacterium]|nr:copper homeostasis protein CutC [Bacteroidales bacterium]
MGPFTQIEVCANSAESAFQAQLGGAFRVELCDNLSEGGTTPAASMVKLAREKISIQLNVLIRPRPGDFLYTEDEFQMMLYDIQLVRDLGADGVVIGVLNDDATIDITRIRQLIRAAEGMTVTFHRAIDMCKDPLTEVMKLQDLGVNRVLSSGGANKAIDGLDLLRDMVQATDFQPIIMPGSGINEDNILQIKEITEAIEFHVSLRNPVPSRMLYHKEHVKMGGIPGYDEYAVSTTNASRVRKILELVNSINYPT